MAQLASRLPHTTGFTNSRLGHPILLSLWTKLNLTTFSSDFLPFAPITNFIPEFLHAHQIHFVSFHQPLWCCERHGRPASLIFRDVEYRGCVSHPIPTQPCVGQVLRRKFIIVGINMPLHEREPYILILFLFRIRTEPKRSEKVPGHQRGGYESRFG